MTYRSYNAAISKAIAYNEHDKCDTKHTFMTKHLKTENKITADFISSNLAGKPRDNIFDILCKEKGIFEKGQIYEILTEEVCSFIKRSFESCEADIIYFHGSYSGIEACCIKKSNVFGDTIPEMFCYDIHPKPMYDIVDIMNVKDKIPSIHEGKRIMVVYVYPHIDFFDKIIEGIHTNKDNYVGAIFIGDLLSNNCVPDTINLTLARHNWTTIEFGNSPSTSFNEIYDKRLFKTRQTHLDVEQNYYSSTQIFYANKNVSYKKEPQHSLEGWKKLKTILNFTTRQVLTILMIEQIYLITYYGITWDYTLISIPKLLTTINTIMMKINTLDLKPFINDYIKYIKKYVISNPSIDGNYSDIPINPKERNLNAFFIIFTEYLNTIHKYKSQITKLLFINNKDKYKDTDIATSILPFITLKTDSIYRQKIHMILSDIKIYNIEEIKASYCHVCLKPYKYKCAICNNGSYCSKTCQLWDWTINNHKVSCKKIMALNNNEALNKKLKKMMKTNTGNMEEVIINELKKLMVSK